MLEYEKIGRQIAVLRKDRGLTGEKLAEKLGVSPQAVSKWETGKCLPETGVLPLLATVLDCSIDSILMPKELQILNATYGDGSSTFDVTRILDGFVRNNKLNIVITEQLFGCGLDGEKIKILSVKYQTPTGVFLTYACEGNVISIDTKTTAHTFMAPLRIIGAYYGNQKDYRDVMNKIEHYRYFKYKEIHVNHETFPSSTRSDSTDYLTLIYINHQGIYTVCCSEGNSLKLNSDKTHFFMYDKSQESFVLPDIMQLNWGEGIDCTWAGALYASLRNMGHDVTYPYIMGISSACFRIAFTPIWDFSSVDALVVYDYAKLAYSALGYELIWADRIEKEHRSSERQNIIRDIKAGKPPIAINLRIAPEWGVISGYMQNGKELLVRTYFDKSVFNANIGNLEFEDEMKKTNGYLFADCWPFAIAHFGDRIEKPSEKENLLNSLRTKIESMSIPERRGYLIGYEAYNGWIKELLRDELFTDINEPEVQRRMQVNDYQLLNLLDARRCAAQYLKESVPLLKGRSAELLMQIGELFQTMTKSLENFYNKLQQQKEASNGYMEKDLIQSKGAFSKVLRLEEAELLRNILEMEQKSDEIAKAILDNEK